MPLSDTAIRLTKPSSKTIRKSDGGGLVLLINPNGSRWWRFRYRINGKAKMLSLGTYPDTSLADARQKRDELRKLVAAGIDPSDQRKATREATADTFKAVCLEWFAKISTSWVPSHATRNMQRLERHVFPYLADKPVSNITPVIILELLNRIEETGNVETAHRVKQIIGMTMRYAVATGRADHDPTASLKGALAPTRVKHHPALLDPIAIGAVLRQFDGYGGYPPVRAGLRLGPMLFCRPGELRQMKWADLDLQAGEWRFTLSKTRQAHIVPLSRQAIAIITAMLPLTGKGCYVMPSQRSPTGERPMSDAAITAAYRALGIEQDVLVAHGWRATARTLLVEQLKFPVDQVEQQLGHQVKDALGRAYNRTTFLEERRSMMQAWSDYLDNLKNPTA